MLVVINMCKCACYQRGKKLLFSLYIRAGFKKRKVIRYFLKMTNHFAKVIRKLRIINGNLFAFLFFILKICLKKGKFCLKKGKFCLKKG